MSFLIPETTFYFAPDNDNDMVFFSMKENLIGERLFSIETLFGNKDANYYGEYGDNQIDLTRKIDSLNKIPIYPTSRITFSSNQNKKGIKVRCSLSAYWRFFIYSIYILLLFGLVFNWFYSDSLQSKIILLSKIFGSILILNIIIFGYHYSEVRNVKKIIGELLKKQNQ